MFRSPSGAGLPALVTMLDDIPATEAQIARHLDIKPSTLATYRRKGTAPRSVMLALFWETKWGRSVADTEAANYAQLQRGHAQALQGHVGRLAGSIWKLEMELEKEKAGQPGKPANLPLWRFG